MTKSGPDFFDFNAPRPREGWARAANEFESLVNSSRDEAPIQKYLEDNPWILGQQFPHGHFVRPQFRFGGKYVADFVVLEMASCGTFVELIELESPCAQLMTKNGDFAAKVRTGIRQVGDWKDYITRNRRLAFDPVELGGLGLDDVAGIHATVVVGRARDVTPKFNELRKRAFTDSHVRIVTYDNMIQFLLRRTSG